MTPAPGPFDVAMECIRCHGLTITGTYPTATFHDAMDALRETATLEGWTITPVEDICPGCPSLTETPPEPAPE